MSDDSDPDPARREQRALEIRFQNALLLYKQSKRLYDKQNNETTEPVDPAPTDLSLSLNKNNILVVDGYVRSISESIQRIPEELSALIKAFYPRAHHIQAIGWNHYGEMAVGHNQPLVEFKSLVNFQTVCDDSNDIHPGWKRFIVRNCFNELYCVGRNMENDLGIEFTPKPNEISRFQKMKPLKNESCYRIFSGNFSFHTFILSSKHNLYAFGQNTSSQCGHKANSDDKNAEEKAVSATPVLLGHCIQIFDGESITKISCGDNFSLFLTQNGQLFSCGNNRFGSCGFPINENMYRQVIDKPTRIALDDGYDVKMIDVNCGGRHVICISNDHNVWCFGQNLFHQLGFGKLYNSKYRNNENSDEKLEEDRFDPGRPTMNPHFANKKIVSTVCGFSHTLAIDENGDGYFFGRNHKAQCGKYHDGKFSVFDTIQTPILFQSIASNETADSFLYNLSDEEAKEEKAARVTQPFENVEIRDGSGGYEHTILITRDNQLIAFGGNASKQCCSRSAQLIVSPFFIKKTEIGLHENQVIERVICGIDTTLIVCSC